MAACVRRAPVAARRAGLRRGARRGAVLSVRADASYYEQIDGKKYDRGVLDACRKAVKGVGDGRISKEDAVAIMEEVLDGGGRGKSAVTDIEMDTIQYALDNFKWTDAAKEWFEAKLTEQNW
mmetsp:Transcript_25569/g.87585  ORF Transcript_25569/g.87585 Transcript_25569/m.87585 type:complete len:122 (-) Transcript_25569:170-535(-)